MQIRKMSVEDIDLVLPLYIEYYNKYEGAFWTEITAKKRIKQVLTIEDSFALIMKDDDIVYGFVMGYFKQYDDVLGYTLEEIVISYQYQNQGLGSMLLATLETKVKEAGASCIELQAVNDKKHEKYYAKAGYADAKNFVIKVKWFE